MNILKKSVVSIFGAGLLGVINLVVGIVFDGVAFGTSVALQVPSVSITLRR